MIEISVNSIGTEGGGDGSEFFIRLAGLGDVEGLVRAATVAFAPPGVRVLMEEAIERSIANDQEAAQAETIGLSVEDYRAEREQQELLSLFTEKVGSIMEDLENLLEEQPKREPGFVRVQGSDTWLPRGLYEGQQWAKRQEARRPQRGPWPGCRPEWAGGT